MAKTFAALDDVLIERLFQPISDLMAFRIGLGLGATACLCVDLASLSWIASRVGGLSDAVMAWQAGTAFLDLCFLLFGLVAMISLRTIFRRAIGKPTNPLRLTMQRHRAVVLLMLLARLAQIQASGLADGADCAMLLFAACALYLGACIERPTSRRARTALASTG